MRNNSVHEPRQVYHLYIGEFASLAQTQQSIPEISQSIGLWFLSHGVVIVITV